MSRRKGASPYVGAVMLVVIAISAGFFLSQWYYNMVKEKAEKTESEYEHISLCKDILFSYYGMEFNTTGNNYFRMFVENNGNVPFTLTNIVVFGANGNQQIINDSYAVNVGEVKRISFMIDSNVIDNIDFISMSVKECGEKGIHIEEYEIFTPS